MKKIIINSLVGILATTSLTGCLATKDLGGIGGFTVNKTIKCEGHRKGSEIFVNGTSYLVVDNSTIKSNLDRAETLCTSNVTNMRYLFSHNKTFNKDISSWDVSNVKYMGFMFNGASSFNQDISGWDVSNVVQMNNMFNGASSFNQDIGRSFFKGWDVSNVEDMYGMFQGATSFNQDISGWDCVKVELPYREIAGMKAFTSTIPTNFVNENFNKSYLPNCSQLKVNRFQNNMRIKQYNSSGLNRR